MIFDFNIFSEKLLLTIDSSPRLVVSEWEMLVGGLSTLDWDWPGHAEKRAREIRTFTVKWSLSPLSALRYQTNKARISQVRTNPSLHFNSTQFQFPVGADLTGKMIDRNSQGVNQSTSFWVLTGRPWLGWREMNWREYLNIRRRENIQRKYLFCYCSVVSLLL